jgi:hypothetical protein
VTEIVKSSYAKAFSGHSVYGAMTVKISIVIIVFEILTTSNFGEKLPFLSMFNTPENCAVSFETCRMIVYLTKKTINFQYVGQRFSFNYAGT